MERFNIPLPSLILGFGPVLLLALLSLAAWGLPYPWWPVAIASGWVWGAAILLFLAGVARGLGFFSPGGATPPQIGYSLWLFALALAALAAGPQFAFPLLAIGYATVGLMDPRLAHNGRAPAHFARLRPPQMAIAVLALGALAARVWATA
jgi:hypothetical protein